MAEHSTIEWTDATWNPVTGCAVVSPGCTNCYAMRLAGTRLAQHPSRAGLTRDTKAGPVWTGEVRLSEEWLDQPLRWRRPRRIFVCAHGDLFAEQVPDEWIDRVFAVMALAPQHTFQVLTKRAARMREYLTQAERLLGERDGSEPRSSTQGRVVVRAAALDRERFMRNEGVPRWPLPNVWLGVSAEDQRRADERIPDLLATPAAVRFVSAEPLLGPVRLDRIKEGVDDFADCGGHPDPYWPLDTCDAMWLDALRGAMDAEARAPDGSRRGDIDVGLVHGGGKLDWVIVGGESGRGARPMHPDWARSIRDQCAAAGVPFFFKQWGEWAPGDAFGVTKDGPITDRRGNVPDWMRRYVVCGDQWADRLTAHTFTGHGTNLVYRVGKHRAGRLLDGREHSAMPEVRP